MNTRTLLIAGGSLLLAGTSAAQSRYFFSVNWHGPTVGTLSPSGVPITEGDILRPSTSTSMPTLGPLPAPSIAIPHTTGLGLPPVCTGHLGGTPCIVEVDAYSRGIDRVFQPNVPVLPGDVIFSVDEFARGIPFGGAPAPNLPSEASAAEAAPDTFTALAPHPPAPIPPTPVPNIAVVDGNGLPSASGFAYPGVGTVEPNAPFGGLPDTGDNKDAVDLAESVTGGPPGANFFSLDSAFFDPFEGVPNSGSALANGFVGGDVLTVGATGAPVVFAPAFVLGLDFVGGPDSDDLDALILAENGTLAYEPSSQPYDWVSGSTDMLIFSVRRGSAVIGMPDSIFGIPIEEGDLLVPPVAGGVSPFPGIFMAAEANGLSTLRTGTANVGDDLNAADAIWSDVFDCDGDGVEDSVAIALGAVPDLNANGIPDGCEAGPVGVPYCFCPAAVAPCGNDSGTTGCINAAGTGALLTGFGTTSVALDDLVLTTSGMTPASFALTFMGTAAVPPVPIGNGLLCVSGSLFRFPPYATGAGTASIGPGLVAYTLGANPPPGWITSGSTWNFQTYYRDIGGPCGAAFNLSNALTVSFTP
ncbi:MAG: hypothetical protein AAF726_18005 [Planctomycetota bacterium]